VDRFLFKVDLGYLPLADEVAMLDRFQASSPLDDLLAVTSPAELAECQAACAAVYCDPALKEYCVRLVQRTRQHPDVALGASPRAASVCSTRPRPGPRPRVANSSFPTTSRGWRRGCSPTG